MGIGEAEVGGKLGGSGGTPWFSAGGRFGGTSGLGSCPSSREIIA